MILASTGGMPRTRSYTPTRRRWAGTWLWPKWNANGLYRTLQSYIRKITFDLSTLYRPADSDVLWHIPQSLPRIFFKNGRRVIPGAGPSRNRTQSFGWASASILGLFEMTSA